MIRSSFAKAAVAALSLAAVTATTAAAQTTIGRINFTGSADVGDQPGNAANLLIDFLSGNPPTVPGGTTGTLITSESITGIFDNPPVITAGMTATITDLIFNGAAGGALQTGTLNVGGYTFTFIGQGAGNAFGPISLIPVGSGTAATFGVIGNVTGNGLLGNQFSGVFSAQFANQSPAAVLGAIQGGQTLPVGISAEFSVSSVVPEPSTYMLLASGIGALGLVARRRRTQV